MSMPSMRLDGANRLKTWSLFFMTCCAHICVRSLSEPAHWRLGALTRIQHRLDLDFKGLTADTLVNNVLNGTVINRILYCGRKSAYTKNKKEGNKGPDRKIKSALCSDSVTTKLESYVTNSAKSGMCNRTLKWPGFCMRWRQFAKQRVC